MRVRCNWSKARRAEARQDIRKILALAPSEVVGVRDALVADKINGNLYEGECCCLVGTIAKLRGISVQTQCWFYPLERAIRADPERPAEQFFASIREDETPETNGYAKLALSWIDEWIDEQAQKITLEHDDVFTSA